MLFVLFHRAEENVCAQDVAPLFRVVICRADAAEILKHTAQPNIVVHFVLVVGFFVLLLIVRCVCVCVSRARAFCVCVCVCVSMRARARVCARTHVCAYMCVCARARVCARA